MMNQINSILTLPLNCDSSVELICKIFMDSSLRVTRSFDLKSACSAFSNNICQVHGDGTCDCQLVVLLVYNQERLPVSVVLHGHNGKTQLGFADDLGHAAPPNLLKLLQRLLSFEAVNARLKEATKNAN